MRQEIEIRIPEQSARTFLRGNIGVRVGNDLAVRILRLDLNDPLILELADIDRHRVAEGGALITSWIIRRFYSKSEIERAEIFTLRFRHSINCAGEQFGTTYDRSSACIFCGFRRKQTSSLRLGCKCRPRPDVTTTLAADEILVSDFLTSLTKAGETVGAELLPIEWTGKCPSLESWRQLKITSQPIRVDRNKTVFGESPFERPNGNRTACPLGHIAGLNMLSELHCLRNSYDGSYFAATDIAVGSASGLLVPAPVIIVSGQFGRKLMTARVRGVEFEVAYLE